MTDLPDLPGNPLDLFHAWFDEAGQDVELANTMAVATATPDGRPSNRYVLLKEANERGFVFFTNYESRKGMELSANPRAAAVMFWPQPRRQVRIEGRVERLAEAESDEYFRTRDRLSQLGAAVSPQSRVIESRSELDQEVERAESLFQGGDVERPAHWGGYRLVPDVIEFWIGREGRLHDRFRYVRRGDGWTIDRLAP